MTFRRFALVAAPVVALAQPACAADSYRLDIAPGTLGSALAALGRQARISVGLSDRSLSAEPVAGLHGIFSAEQALSQLLRGKPARYLRIDRRTFVVVRARDAAVPPPKTRSAVKRPPVATTAVAQQPIGEEEIIITATKRPTPLDRYAGPAVILTEDDLGRERGLQGSEALIARVPIVISTHLGPGRNKLFLRGIADSSFSGPTQSTVAQYFGEARMNFDAPDPDLRLYDVEQVEILPGPQATLYGAGSLGGVIRIDPRQPDPSAVSGRLSLGGSRVWHGDAGYDAAAVINLPLAQSEAAARFVAYRESDPGYIDDPRRHLRDTNRVHVGGGRASLLATPGQWSLGLVAMAQNIRGDDAQFADKESPPLNRLSSVRQNYANRFSLVEAEARRDGPVALLASASAVRQRVIEHFDATSEKHPRTLTQKTRVELNSFEARLWSRKSGRAGWVLGASAIDNLSDQVRSSDPPNSALPAGGVRNHIREAAIYGELTLPLTRRIETTVGARLANSRLSGALLTAADEPAGGSSAPDRTEIFLVPSLTLGARPNDRLLLYGRYQQGFRPGGFAIFGDIVQNFRSDRLAAVEIGSRYSDRAPRSLQLSGSLAFTRWSHIQADTLDLAGLPTTRNIGNGRIYTATADVSWKPISSVRLSAAGVWNDSLVTNPSFGIIGVVHSPLPNVARLSSRVEAEYSRSMMHGELNFSASSRYVGKSRLGAGPVLGRDQGGWFLLDAGLRLTWPTRELSLSVTNILDSARNQFAFGSPFTLVANDQVTPLRPRTVRLGLNARF